jgi:hypothetical protein
MTKRILGYGVAAIAVMSVLSFVLVSRPAAQGFGQEDQAAIAKAKAAPTPRMPDGHPNLTGFWGGGGAGEGGTPDAANAETGEAAAPAGSDEFTRSGTHEITRTADGSVFFSYAGANGGTEAGVDGYDARPKVTAPYKPEYLAKVNKILAVHYGRTNIYDPNDACEPAGVPRASFNGFVVSSPEATAIMYEATPGPYYRIVYTDGRKHPSDWDTSYMGHSIGHWEGDTLVVDTVALDDTTWLQNAGNSIHSDKEHVVERWTRKGNVVTVETTVEDPVMFTKPWVLPTRNIMLNTGNPDTYGNQIIPSMCNTNDHAHWVVNDKYVCNWCAPESLYGGTSDKLTVPSDCRNAKGVASPCQPPEATDPRLTAPAARSAAPAAGAAPPGR